MKQISNSEQSVKFVLKHDPQKKFCNKKVELNVQKNIERISKIQSSLESLDSTNFDGFINELTLLTKDLGVAVLELRPYYPDATKVVIDQMIRITDFCHKKDRKQIIF